MEKDIENMVARTKYLRVAVNLTANKQNLGSVARTKLGRTAKPASKCSFKKSLAECALIRARSSEAKLRQFSKPVGESWRPFRSR